jgi:hypothetical protein
VWHRPRPAAARAPDGFTCLIRTTFSFIFAIALSYQYVKFVNSLRPMQTSIADSSAFHCNQFSIPLQSNLRFIAINPKSIAIKL